MYHSGLIKEFEEPKKIDYSKLKDPSKEKSKLTPQIPTDSDVPQAPDGFMFYRIVQGDTMVSLAVKFGVSENKIRRYNNRACFGHRLSHIIGKLLLIPIESNASMSKDVREQIANIYAEDNERKQDDDSIDGKKYSEPDENGKYQLKKALMYHANGLDDQRAVYYLSEANWNVRNALKKWREDDTWERMHHVVQKCAISQEEAMQRLVALNWDDVAVIKQWQKEQKKDSKMMAKINRKLLGKNTKTKTKGDADSLKGGIEMNVQHTPRGADVQEQEETKGDGDGDGMNEGQPSVTSNDNTMAADTDTVHVTAEVYANTCAVDEAAAANEMAAAEEVSVDQVTLQ